MSIVNWVMSRTSEPSTWAAIATVCIGAAVLIDNFWVAVGGIAVSAIAIVLREKGVI